MYEKKSNLMRVREEKQKNFMREANGCLEQQRRGGLSDEKNFDGFSSNGFRDGH